MKKATKIILLTVGASTAAGYFIKNNERVKEKLKVFKEEMYESFKENLEQEKLKFNNYKEVMESENQKLKEEKESLAQENEMLQNKRQEEKNQFVENKAVFEEEKQNLINKNKDLVQENKTLKNEQSAQQTKIDTIQDDYNNYELENQKLKAEKEQLIKEQEEIETENKSLREKIERFEKEETSTPIVSETTTSEEKKEQIFETEDSVVEEEPNVIVSDSSEQENNDFSDMISNNSFVTPITSELGTKEEEIEAQVEVNDNIEEQNVNPISEETKEKVEKFFSDTKTGEIKVFSYQTEEDSKDNDKFVYTITFNDFDKETVKAIYQDTNGNSSEVELKVYDGVVQFALGSNETLIIKELPENTHFALSQSKNEKYVTKFTRMTANDFEKELKKIKNVETDNEAQDEIVKYFEKTKKLTERNSMENLVVKEEGNKDTYLFVNKKPGEQVEKMSFKEKMAQMFKNEDYNF